MNHCFLDLDRRLVSTLFLVVALCAGSLPGRSQPPGATGEVEQRYQAGARALQQGDALTALNLLGSVAAQDAAYKDVQMLLGQSCLLAGLPRPAKQHFEAAFEQQPGNGQAAFFLGYSLYESARYFEAAETLQTARRLAPQNPLPRIYRGLALLRLGDAEKAAAEVKAGLAMAPGDPTGELALAELDLAAGKHDQAVARIRSVLRRSPQGIDGKVLLGRALLEGGKAEEAVPVFEDLVSSQPPRSDLLYLLGQAQLRSGDREGGRATMRQFRELQGVESEVRLLELDVNLDPDDAETRLRLVSLMLEHGMEASALPHVAALERQLPGDPRLEVLLRRLRPPS